MMRRDTGETVSCKEMADYQYARTFVVTFGRIDIDAVKNFIRNYPSGRLLKEAYLEIGRFYRLQDEEGRAFYDEFVSKFPDDPDVLKAFVNKVNEVPKAPEANESLARGIELAERLGTVYPSVTPIQAAKDLAQLQVNRKDPDQAEIAFGADFLAGQIKAWADGLLTYAEFWLNQKRNIEEAEAAIEKALNLAPDSPEVRRRAAAAYHFHLNKPEKALDVFGPAYLVEIGANAQTLYDYFKFWITLKTNLESAEEALEMIWKLKPETVYYRIGAASVFLKPGKNERALAVFGPEFAAGRQDDLPALYDYGAYWVHQGLNLESAVPALTRALSLSPSSWTNHWQAAAALTKVKKQEAALKVFGPEFLPNIKDDPLALSQYAQFWIEQNSNRESAIAALEMAVRIADMSPLGRNRVAYTLVRAGLRERAEEIYGPEHLTKINDDPMALHLYASFWGYQTKNLASALTAAERACQIDNDNPRNWSVLSQVLWASGRPEEALKALDKAISLEKFKDAKERHEPKRKLLLEALGKGKK